MEVVFSWKMVQAHSPPIHIHGKGLVSTICEKPLKLNKQNKSPVINGQKFEQTVHKCNIQMSTKIMQWCSPSIVIREVQIEISIRYHYSSTVMTKIKKSINSHTYLVALWNGRTTLENYLAFFNNVNMHQPYDPAIPILDLPKRNKSIYPDKDL